jgi:hypothetical protein
MVALTAGLAGSPVLACDDHQARTVSYFKEHQDEMKAVLAKCEDNPGGARHDDECINAHVAREKVSYDEYLKSAKPAKVWTGSDFRDWADKQKAKQ